MLRVTVLLYVRAACLVILPGSAAAITSPSMSSMAVTTERVTSARASLRTRAFHEPLLKNEWVEMGDPTPPHRRTHGGTGAGVLALVKPLPPKAVAGRPGFTRAKRPRLRSPPADRWAAVQDHALAPSLLPRATSPIRNSIEPFMNSPAWTGVSLITWSVCDPFC